MSNSVTFSDLLRRLIAGEDLQRGEIERLFGQLMDGELSVFEKTALLVALACKGESSDEIAGAASAMRGRLLEVSHSQLNAVDTCGTGGDGLGTVNISTAAALCAAAAGVPIAKHGNRSVSSKSGSADVLAALGLELDLSPAVMGRCLDQVGIAFLFAPLLHPAMREAMPVRNALGVRTVFNVLGPLTNPAGAKRQVMGVFSEHLVLPIAEVLRELGSVHALVVHGADGLDELSTTGPTSVAEVKGATITEYTLVPEDFGLKRRSMSELLGGTPEENAVALRRVLGGADGAESAHAEIAAFNAAAALYVGDKVEDLAAGVAVAKRALASGAGLVKLQELVAFAEAQRGGSGQAENAQRGDQASGDLTRRGR